MRAFTEVLKPGLDLAPHPILTQVIPADLAVTLTMHQELWFVRVRDTLWHPLIFLFAIFLSGLWAYVQPTCSEGRPLVILMWISSFMESKSVILSIHFLSVTKINKFLSLCVLANGGPFVNKAKGTNNLAQNP